MAQSQGIDVRILHTEIESLKTDALSFELKERALEEQLFKIRD